jgi:pre-rRNA-processing protein TSR1
MYGTGTVKSIDPLRMIIKRIILTGNPYRTIGRSARVTLMFFNKEDVLWFKKVNLSTKNKQRGHIEKPIGLSGRFKATFKDIVRPDDTVCMFLYKRVFPRLCRDDGSFVTAPVSF